MVYFLLCIYFFILLGLVYYYKNKINIVIFVWFYWGIFLFLGVYVFGSIYSFHDELVAYLIVVNVMFLIGYELSGNRLRSRLDNLKTRKIMLINIEYNSNVLRYVFMVQFLYLIYMFADVYADGRWTQILSLSGLLNLFLNSRDIKYSFIAGESDVSILKKIVELLYFSSLTVYGFMFSRGNRQITFLIVINAILSMVFSGMKAMLIFSLVMFFSGYLSNKFLCDDFYLKDIKFFRLILYSSIFVMSLIFIMDWNSNIDFYDNPLIIYALGEIPAFDFFLANNNFEYTYGVQTFYGIISFLFGNIPFSEGASNYSIDAGLSIETNIFTSFRGLITDFGIIGSLIGYFLLGYFCNSFKLRQKYNFCCLGLYMFIVGYMLLSFLISIGYYLTLTVAFIFSSIICRIAFIKN